MDDGASTVVFAFTLPHFFFSMPGLESIATTTATNPERVIFDLPIDIGVLFVQFFLHPNTPQLHTVQHSVFKPFRLRKKLSIQIGSLVSIYIMCLFLVDEMNE